MLSHQRFVSICMCVCCQWAGCLRTWWMWWLSHCYMESPHWANSIQVPPSLSLTYLLIVMNVLHESSPPCSRYPLSPTRHNMGVASDLSSLPDFWPRSPIKWPSINLFLHSHQSRLPWDFDSQEHPMQTISNASHFVLVQAGNRAYIDLLAKCTLLEAEVKATQ